MVTTWLLRVGSRVTEWMVWMMVSFCMSVCRKVSMKNSKNSYKTPMVMESRKQQGQEKGGELKGHFSLSLSRMTMEKPTAAARKPLRVWSMVSQLGTTT